jgi:hypothetical protein
VLVELARRQEELIAVELGVDRLRKSAVDGCQLVKQVVDGGCQLLVRGTGGADRRGHRGLSCSHRRLREVGLNLAGNRPPEPIVRPQRGCNERKTEQQGNPEEDDLHERGVADRNPERQGCDKQERLADDRLPVHTAESRNGRGGTFGSSRLRIRRPVATASAQFSLGLATQINSFGSNAVQRR